MTKNPHLGGDAIEHLEKIIPDTHEMRLIGLLEWCKFIEIELKLGRIDNAKEYLARAIAEAEKPWPDIADLKEAIARYLPPNA